MTTDADATDAIPAKGSKMPIILGLVLALFGGGSGFFAVNTGILGGSDTSESVTETQGDAPDSPVETFAFVAIDPLIISLPSSNGRDHLRFAAQLEVDPKYVTDVDAVKPRIVDVLNGYLRAVDLAELEDPAALMRLRAQMLRRIQVVTGQGRVKDLLIMEFVLS
jgi:flagellar FliL protein